MPELKEVEQDFLHYVKKMEAYKEALGLIYWDLKDRCAEKWRRAAFKGDWRSIV